MLEPIDNVRERANARGQQVRRESQQHTNRSRKPSGLVRNSSVASAMTSVSLGASDNMCSKHLLNLVARGCAILTELTRLAELVPAAFCVASSAANKRRQNAPSEEDLLCDFSYFECAAEFEARIDADERLKQADEWLCEQHLDTLVRFYLTFESVHRYARDLNAFMAQLDSGAYIGQTLDTLLSDTLCLQLLAEAYYLLGVMLLTGDTNFDGNLRERLIVAHYRYGAHSKSSLLSSSSSLFDNTCKLWRSTGFECAYHARFCAHKQAKPRPRPSEYPESLFARCHVDKQHVNLIIAKLQSTDVYNQTQLAFAHPDHRSAALGQQAAMLYVLLYFVPEVLHSQRGRMRELVDKLFADNWCVSAHMGHMANLLDAWQPYKAAREALAHVHEPDQARALAGSYAQRARSVSRELARICSANDDDAAAEGANHGLNEATLLEQQPRILAHVREANALLKWQLLHCNCAAASPDQAALALAPALGMCAITEGETRAARQLAASVAQVQPDTRELYELLERLAIVERHFGALYASALQTRPERVRACTQRATEALEELLALLDLRAKSASAQSSGGLAGAIRNVVGQLEELRARDEPRDDIIMVANALERALDAHVDASGRNSHAAAQLIGEAREALVCALQALALDAQVHASLASIGDLSYAWRLVVHVDKNAFVEHMRAAIKATPRRIDRVETVFAKLACAPESHLMRIAQLDSAESDLISVSQFYTSKLVGCIREVLHVIPETILELLSRVVDIEREERLHLQTAHLSGGDNIDVDALPSRITLEQLRAFASRDRRHAKLELTYKLSHYAESLLSMRRTTVGLVRVDARQLLEDGMRRELVRRMSDAIRMALLAEQECDATGHFAVVRVLRPQKGQQSCEDVAGQLRQRVGKLRDVIAGYRSSFELIHDYLPIYGLRVWQEELARIVCFNTELAVNTLSQHSDDIEMDQQASWCTCAAPDTQAAIGRAANACAHQWSRAPVPTHGNCALGSSFMLRLANELLRATNPRATRYESQAGAWFACSSSSRSKVLDSKLFEAIGAALGAPALACLDELFCCLLGRELLHLDTLALAMLFRQVDSARVESLQLWLAVSAASKCNSDNSTTANIARAYQDVANALRRQPAAHEQFVGSLLRVGQLQLLRATLAFALSNKCRHEARDLYHSADAINDALMHWLAHASTAKDDENMGTACADCQQTREPRKLAHHLDDSQLMFELARHLDAFGIGGANVMDKIYTLQLHSARPNAQVHEARRIHAHVYIVHAALTDELARAASPASLADSHPLLVGAATLLAHCSPYLHDSAAAKQAASAQPIQLLLHLMGVQVRCALELSPANRQQHDSYANTALAMIELMRICRQQQQQQVPEFVLQSVHSALSSEPVRH